MNVNDLNPARFVFARKIPLLAALLLAGAVSACRTVDVSTSDSIRCKDRPVYINREKQKAVEEETVVVCHNKRVLWTKRHNENWKVHFDVSPYKSGVKDITEGVDPGPFVEVDQDTPFPYLVTVDGKVFDPQIILIGGH